MGKEYINSFCLSLAASAANNRPAASAAKSPRSAYLSQPAASAAQKRTAELTATDLRTAIKYLEDAATLYDALAALPVQKAACRSHMIKQLIVKLKAKLPK